MSKFQFARLCAIALLVFTLIECAIELVSLPDTLKAVTSFDLQNMTYSLLGISSDVESVVANTQPLSLIQQSFNIVFSLLILSCQLLGAVGVLMVNRESLGRFGRFSVRIWIFFSALALVSAVVPVVSSAMTSIDRSVEQQLAQGVDSANESILNEYPIIVEALELLQTADIPKDFFVKIYTVLIISTLLMYTFLVFIALKMWRDAKKFRYS